MAAFGLEWFLHEWADPRLGVPVRPFRGLIFDCDGTLVDSMPIHYRAWLESLRHHEAPYDFPEEEFYALAGVREQDAVRLLNAKHGAEVDPDSVAEYKSALFQHRSLAPIVFAYPGPGKHCSFLAWENVKAQAGIRILHN